MPATAKRSSLVRSARAHVHRAVGLVAILALLVVGGLLFSPSARADFTWVCGTGCTWTTTFGPPGQPSPEASCAARADASPNAYLGWVLGTGVPPLDFFWYCMAPAGGFWGEISVQGSCPTAPPGASLKSPPSLATRVADGHVALCSYFGPPPTCPGNQDCKPPKVVGPPDCHNPGGQDCTSHPIRLGTGNKFLVEMDYTSGGIGLLRFVRYYNSDLSVVTQHLGQHWSSTWDRAVLASGIQANVLRPDGKRFLFNQVGGVWTPDADVDAKLTAQTDSGGNLTGWTYQNPDDDTETYDRNGRLTAVSNRAGLTVHIAQDINGRVHSVTDPFGRALSFAYDSLSRLSTLTDPIGQLITYAYDTNQNLSGVTYQDATVRTYVYENTGFPAAVTGIVDENGNRYSTYAYDAAGRATSSGLAGGADQVTINYNGDGTQTVTDALNTARTYTFQTAQGVVVANAVSQPCDKCPGQTDQSRSFDANGNLASRTDFNGNRTDYTYDPTRNLETQRIEGLTSSDATTSVTRSITTEWDATFRLPHRIAEPLRITTIIYDAHGNARTKTIQATSDASGALGLSASPTGTPRTWTYNYTYSDTIAGQVIHLVADGPRTDVADTTAYDWDNSGNLTTVTNALGHLTALSNYDAHGRPHQITDPNGLVTTLGYDVRGRLTSRSVGGELTSYDYDAAGQLHTLTLPDGSFLSYSYDAAHRLRQIADNLGNQIGYDLDAMGNRRQEHVLDPNSVLVQAHSREYDALNRLSRDIGGTNPATQVTQYGYDNQGNLTTIVDPLGHLTTNVYDALNRLAKAIDPAAFGAGAGANTQYGYDGLDQLTQVTDPRGLATGYTIDGLGNLTRLASPDTGLTSSGFDAAGNLTSQLDPRGVSASFAYDALNRIRQATYSPPAGSSMAPVSISYAFDQGPFALGRLTGIAGPGGSISYSYDVHGRLTQDARTIAGVTHVTGYGYDPTGRLTHLTYPSGRSVDYTLDALGRIQQIDSTYQGTTQAIVSNVAYQPFGPIKGFTFGNASGSARGFDFDGRIAGYTLGSITRSVGYDDASRLTAFSHTNAALNQSFGYDNLNRLTDWTTPASNQSFGYDPVGNRTSQTIGANSYPYTYSAVNNQLSNVAGPTINAYQYDPAGNLSTTSHASFAYDARHRLIQASFGSQGAGYQVNALGQRVMKTPTLGAATVYHYDSGGRLIAESDPQGNVQVEYLYLGDTPVAVIQ